MEITDMVKISGSISNPDLEIKILQENTAETKKPQNFF
jgi:hypothetical protein